MRRLLSLLLGPLLVTGALSVTAAPATAEDPLLPQVVTIDEPAPGTLLVGEEWTPVLTGGASGNPVLLTGTAEVCTAADGVVSFVGAGTCTVTADQAGSTTHAAAAPVTRTFTIALRPVDVAISWTDPPTPVDGDRLVITATVTDRGTGDPVPGTATLAASGTTPDGARSMTAGAEAFIRTITVVGGTAHVLTVAFTPSTATTWATASASRTLTALSTQVLTIDSPDAGTLYVGETWTPSTTGGDSGNTVTLTGTAGVCTTTSGVVSFVGAGTCTVTADQAGSTTHAAAAPVTRTFTIALRPVDVAITWTGTPTHATDLVVLATATDRLSGDPVAGAATLTATGADPVSQAMDAGTVTGTLTATIEVVGGSTHVLTVAFTPTTAATWAGGTASRSLAVPKAAQVVTVSAAPGAEELLVGRTWTPTTTGGGSGDPVLLTAGPSGGQRPVCSTSGTPASTIRFLGSGTCTVTATQAGNAHYLAGTVTVVLAIRRPVTVRVTTTPTAPRYGEEVTVVAAATDTLDGSVVRLVATTDALTVEGSTAVATQDGDRLTLTFEPDGAGDHGVEVVLAGTTVHQPLTYATTLTVARAAQTIAVSGTPDPGLVGSTWTPSTVGGGSGRPVVVSAATQDACSVTGGAVQFDSAGTCTVRFDQAGDANHDAAPALLVELEVRIPVDVTLHTSPAAPTVGARLEVRAVARVAGVPVAGTGPLTVTGPDGPVGTDPGTSWFGGGSYFAFRPSRATTYTVTATFRPADASRYAVTTTQRTVAVGRAAQTITVGNPPPDPALVRGTWDPEPTGGGSGEPVTVTATPGTTPGGCTVAAGVVTFTAAGTCRVELRQAGDDDHLAAPTVAREVSVGRIPVQVTVTWPGTPRVDEPVVVTATATATMPDGTEVTVPGTGTLTVGDEGTTSGAWSDGDLTLALTPAHAGDHAVTATFTPTEAAVFQTAAAPAGLELPVARGTQSITLGTEPGATAYVGDRWTPAPAGHGSGGSVGLTVDPGSTEAPACRLEDDGTGEAVVHPHAGTCTVTATLAETPDYLAAPPLVRSVEVLRHPTTVAVEVAGTALVSRDLAVAVTVAGLRHGVTPTAVPGSVTFHVAGRAVGAAVPVTADGRATTVLQLPVAGEHAVGATFVPDDPVSWATDTDTDPVTASRNPQAITLGDGAPTAAVVDATWTPAATASSGLAPVVTLHADSVADGICDLADGTVTFLDPGDCTVLLDQPGDVEHLPAAQHSHTVAVDRTVTTTTVTVEGGAQVGTTARVTATSDGTGAIAFSLARGSDDPEPLGGGTVALVDGVARIEVPATSVAGYQVVATLVPAPARVFHPSSGSVGWSVAKAPTSAAITVSGGRVAVTVSATTPAGGVPTGTVDVTVGAGAPVALALAGGTAYLPGVLPPGADVAITAAYGGDGTRLGSSATGRRGLPRLTHSLSRVPGAHGWHDGPVTVAFRCATSTAPLVTACPAPVTLRADAAGQGLVRSVTAADGGLGVLRVGDVHIDTTAPRVSVTGVREGATYLGSVGAARCSANDATSGVASCQVLSRQRLGRLDFRDTVRATDRAGNTRTASVRFRVLPEWVHRATLRRGTWVTGRRTATLRVLGDSRAPQVLRPRHPRGAPRVAAGLMTPISISNGVWLWEKEVPVPRIRGRRPYRLAVRTGDESRRVLEVVVRRP